MVYEYVADDSQGVDAAQAHERNRSDPARGTNRYLRRVRYGNRTPYFPNYDSAAPATPLPGDQDWMFSVVLDYDEGRYQPDLCRRSRAVAGARHLRPENTAVGLAGPIGSVFQLSLRF